MGVILLEAAVQAGQLMRMERGLFNALHLSVFSSAISILAPRFSAYSQILLVQMS